MESPTLFQKQYLPFDIYLEKLESPFFIMNFIKQLKTVVSFGVLWVYKLCFFNCFWCFVAGKVALVKKKIFGWSFKLKDLCWEFD